MQVDLDGRVALVTGGSRGIGRAIAGAFVGCGASVMVASRNAEACAATAAELGERAAGHAADVSQVHELDGLVAATVERFGGIDILVNNAAVLRPHVVEKVTSEELDEVFATNVKGTVLLAQKALPHLEASDHAVVINLTAVSGEEPMVGLGAYSSSKAAILNWTRVMALEWASKGIRVNAITPGPVATDMILPRDPQARERFLDELAAETPLGRVGRPEDMVGAALFLASDASAFATGQPVVVDGGMLA